MAKTTGLWLYASIFFDFIKIIGFVNRAKNSFYLGEFPVVRIVSAARIGDFVKKYANRPGARNILYIILIHYGKDAEALIHELNVHQIELEMQNEGLRRVQTELDLSLDRYFELYDLAPVGYFTMDSKGLIVQANLTIAALPELKRSDLIRAPFSQFILFDSQDQYYLNLKKKADLYHYCEYELFNAFILFPLEWIFIVHLRGRRQSYSILNPLSGINGHSGGGPKTVP